MKLVKDFMDGRKNDISSSLGGGSGRATYRFATRLLIYNIYKTFPVRLILLSSTTYTRLADVLERFFYLWVLRDGEYVEALRNHPGYGRTFWVKRR